MGLENYPTEQNNTYNKNQERKLLEVVTEETLGTAIDLIEEGVGKGIDRDGRSNSRSRPNSRLNTKSESQGQIQD